jgi:hypothetical protein
VLLDRVAGRIYIEANSSKIYVFDGTNYVSSSSGSLPNATAEVAGIVKLYDQTGYNVDGTMTQRAITKELNEKFEMEVDQDDEMIIFDTDID